MIERRGKFIVFEGIDGSGKTTQIRNLATRIRELDKYQEILLAREPTRKAGEIKRKLENDSDPYSGCNRMTELFIGDRSRHYFSLIEPNLNQGIYVLCDRFSLSTIAYQSTQGENETNLLEMHRTFGIPAPDLTFYLQITPETAKMRKAARAGAREKFEGDDFTTKLIDKYNELVEMAKTRGLVRGVLGDIVVIEGNGPEADVEAQILEEYKSRRN